ncbi:sigma-54 interaction domain-containing protein [Deferrisoma palaeochoriense]
MPKARFRNPREREAFLRSVVNYRDILEAFDEGVILTDREGYIVFYNPAQSRIDQTDPEEALGLKATELYDLTDETSLIMRCLLSGRPVLNEHLVYRTRYGRIANTICSVFPLFGEGGELVGSACFVRDYHLVEQTVTSICSHTLPDGVDAQREQKRFTFDDLIGDHPAFRRVVQTAKTAALTPSAVMLHGETGTGKELFAQAIHAFGPWKDAPYVAINCAAIPENLLEGLLFGTVRGAFTGAVDRPGLFEKANGGVLFLDEVNSMPLGLQAKLLRALQEKRVRRVGSLEERPIAVKLLSSVNEDPHQAVEAGRMRVDLFYRLGVVFLRIPPLRERRSDIPVLVRFFVDRFNREMGRHVEGVADEVMDLFLDYPWPGNVRELEHVIEGAMNVVAERDRLELGDLPPYLVRRRPAAAPSEAPEPGPVPADLKEAQKAAERRAIREALEAEGGNITRAAARLGISRQLLGYKMRRHGLRREEFRRPARGRAAR